MSSSRTSFSLSLASAISILSERQQQTQNPNPINYNDYILSGMNAFSRLVAKANYSIPPITSKFIFLSWVQEICKRKLQTDIEFRERVKVRELR